MSKGCGDKRRDRDRVALPVWPLQSHCLHCSSGLPAARAYPQGFRNVLSACWLLLMLSLASNSKKDKGGQVPSHRVSNLTLSHNPRELTPHIASAAKHMALQGIELIPAPETPHLAMVLSYLPSRRGNRVPSNALILSGSQARLTHMVSATLCNFSMSPPIH